MQMHSSYVVTDPKGQLLSEGGTMLRRGAPKLDENGKPMRDARGKGIYDPYRIKVLNTINFKKSMKYNPFAYIRSEKDILKLVNVIIANTKGDGEKSSEDFWVKAERLLYPHETLPGNSTDPGRDARLILSALTEGNRLTLSSFADAGDCPHLDKESLRAA